MAAFINRPGDGRRNSDWHRNLFPFLAPAAVARRYPLHGIAAGAIRCPAIQAGTVAHPCLPGHGRLRFGGRVLTVTLAVTSFRQHSTPTAIGALIGGAASIGWMAVVNFLIDSNFKWVPLAMALLSAASLVLFWVEKPDRMRS